MSKFSINELAERCALELDRVWLADKPSLDWRQVLPIDVQDAIRRCINSSTKTYRYVLPTQILAKVVDPSLDSRSLQEGSELGGSFDARSLCHRVVVPFDRMNHDVLGGAPEPYVNNPMRIPAIAQNYRTAQRNKTGFDDLCNVLDFLEANPVTALAMLENVIAEIRNRLQSVQIVYPVPNRASLKQAQSVIDAFLSERTGGVRLQAVSLALFQSIGHFFRFYAQVDSATVNAADASTGSVADLTCIDENGAVVLAVEVKDRQLRLRHVQDKLPAVRESGVRELLFVVTSGISESEANSVEEVIDREFVTGQNVYVVPFHQFLESCLILFGETGRREFLIAVGRSIDNIRADLAHRQTWRDLLQQL